MLLGTNAIFGLQRAGGLLLTLAVSEAGGDHVSSQVAVRKVYKGSVLKNTRELYYHGSPPLLSSSPLLSSLATC